MNSAVHNPFRPVKFEDEGAPLVYVSAIAMQQFDIGNYFFTGKRGCGKTSILRISDTIFRFENKYLQNLPNKEQADETFGTYINLNNRTIPDFFKTRHNKVNKKYLLSENTKYDLTGLYLELIIVRNMLEYCIFLRDNSIADIDGEAERLIVTAVSREYKLGSEINIDELQVVVEAAMTELVDFSRSTRDDLTVFHVRVEKKFHTVLGRILSAVRLKTTNIKKIRILIDDCETFSPEFQAALNTLIRTPRGEPISWSIAYVDGRYQASRTTIPQQTLSREERSIIYLDGLDTQEYENFCVEVTRLRMRRAFPGSPDYNIRDRLGGFDVENLVDWSFRDTVGRRPLQFIERYNERQNQRQSKWQFFLEEVGSSEKVTTPDGLRKRGLSAYINMCAKYHLPLFYAGFHTVVSLSDGCIRDFLGELGSIYEAVTEQYQIPLRFIEKSAYGIEEQNDGCRDAARRKIRSINDYAEKNGYYLEKLVHFLGHLAQKFQHDSKFGYGFKTPDRAMFSINISHRNDEYINLIKDAEVDGYIRRVDLVGKQGYYCFRLHRQFAPNFDISYRETPPDPIPIHPLFLSQIKEREMESPDRWATEVFQDWVRRRGNPTQTSFFEEDSE